MNSLVVLLGICELVVVLLGGGGVVVVDVVVDGGGEDDEVVVELVGMEEVAVVEGVVRVDVEKLDEVDRVLVGDEEGVLETVLLVDKVEGDILEDVTSVVVDVKLLVLDDEVEEAVVLELEGVVEELVEAAKQQSVTNAKPYARLKSGGEIKSRNKVTGYLLVDEVGLGVVVVVLLVVGGGGEEVVVVVVESEVVSEVVVEVLKVVELVVESVVVLLDSDESVEVLDMTTSVGECAVHYAPLRREYRRPHLAGQLSRR